MAMRIWIDISNAPHVHFFRALIPRLEEEHEVLVTARDFGPICRLMDSLGIRYECIGSHGGGDLEKKLLKNVERLKELMGFLGGKKPDLGLFKYSVEGSRVCFGLGLKSISVVDNENSESQNRLIIPFSDMVVSPKAIPEEVLRGFGARRIEQFNGICELAHYSGFEPNDAVLKELGLNRDRPIVVARSEPFFASYCRKSSRLFTVLERLAKEAQIVFVPRNERDREMFRKLDILVPDKPIDTLSLYSFADLMIGAGGSMNREAVVAGCPTISLYPEKLLAVDQLLVDRGAMRHTLDEKEALQWAKAVLGNGKEWKAQVKESTKGLENPHELILRELEKV